MPPKQISVDLARDGDVERILEITKLEYGSNSMLETRADYSWRHDKNPAGHSIVPVIRNSAGSVVGFIWAVPVRVRVRGQDHTGAMALDLIIHPEYRNTFGYTRLIRGFDKVFIDHKIPLHISFPSERRFQRQREKTPQMCGTIPLLAKVLDFDSLAGTYLGRRWQRSIINPPGRFVSNLLFRQTHMATREEIQVERVDQFSGEFDEFWREVHDKYPAMTIRDQTYLSWRFAPLSKRNYDILVARAHGQMLGYVVLRCGKRHGIKTGFLTDLMFSEGALGEAAGDHLMAEAESLFRAAKMDVSAGIMVPFANEHRVMRRAGYKLVPHALAPRVFRFMFELHETRDSGLTSLSAQDWYITLADF